MAKRRIGIQWDRGYGETLKREVKNYNERIRYAVNRGVSRETLPPTVKYSDLKKQITTKSEYNKTIRDFKALTYRNLTTFNKAGKTKYEEIMSRRKKTVLQPQPVAPTSKAEQRRKEQLKNVYTDKSPGRFPTESQILKTKLGLKEGDEENAQRVQDWIRQNPSDSLQWKRNYLKGIKDQMEMALTAGNTEGFNNLKELYQKISGMDLEDFLTGQLLEPERLEIDYYYMVRGEGENEYAGRIERLITTWDKYSG